MFPSLIKCLLHLELWGRGLLMSPDMWGWLEGRGSWGHPGLIQTILLKLNPAPLEWTVAVYNYTVTANLQDLDDNIKILMEFSENVVGGNLGKESVKCLARRELWTLQSCTHLQILWNCYQVKICSDSAQTQETLTKLTNMFQKWTGNVSEFSETFSFL